MIVGYLTIPLYVRDANHKFFSQENQNFHGDYKYSWDEKNRFLTVYSKVGNILNSLVTAYIADKVNEHEIGERLIKENNRAGKKKVSVYRVDDDDKLVHVSTYFKRGENEKN